MSGAGRVSHLTAYSTLPFNHKSTRIAHGAAEEKRPCKASHNTLHTGLRTPVLVTETNERLVIAYMAGAGPPE